VSGNASVILNPEPPTKPFAQIGVSGSGFPPNASGHLCVQVAEDPKCDPNKKHIIPNGDFVTMGDEMGGDMSGNFTLSQIVRPIPQGTQDGDMWSAIAIAMVPGPDPPVTAIGDVFVATFPPAPREPLRPGPA
jgi:hypothetical protein